MTTLGVGNEGWEVQSTAATTAWTTGAGGATQAPQAISSPGFDTSSWLPVTADSAGAVGTEVEALLQNGICPDDQSAFPAGTINQSNEGADSIFYSNNLQNCFYGPNVAVSSKIGADTNPLFDEPWWFRTNFSANVTPGQDAQLVINGVVGQADVWVNGTEVASQAKVEGDYTSYTFDVTNLLRQGVNSIAFEMYPDNPSTMFTLDNVDWSQIPPDNNTGIQFPVQLHTADQLGVSNVYVNQNDAADMSSSALTVNADVTNHAASSQTGTVTATITPPHGNTPITVSKNVTVAAGSTQTVTFDPSDYRQLTINHPQLWWPYQMGGQPLYTLNASVSQGRQVDDQSPSSDFAIRSITTMLTKPTDMAADGVRVMEVNGVPFEYRGGGWAENLFLHYSAADTANQIQVVKSLGVNGIRTEGKEMPQSWYDAMDKAGIMIDAGFQCCDKWQPSSRSGLLSQEYHVLYLSALTIGQQLRDHPSVVNFSWSDNPPTKEQEVVSSEGFSQAGFQEPIVSSAEYNTGANYGQSGEKEGPYDWVPPSYFFDTTHGTYNGADDDSTITNDGGAWGFDSEQGSGDSIPTIDSLDRFMSPNDLAALWECPGDHQFHTNYESTTGNCPQAGNGTGTPVIGNHNGYAFGTAYNLDTAIQSRYGAWNSLDGYVEKAQVQNYEDTRAQFEAYADNWDNGPTPSTGTVYWQMNKGWPTLLWDLYNSDYDEAGAFFGAKKGNETLHVMYSLGTGEVGVDNLTGASQNGLSVESRVYSLTGQVTSDQTANGINLDSQEVASNVLKPTVPAATAPPTPAKTYFIELILRQHGQVVDRNVYWQSTQPDVIDWDSTLGNPQANGGDPLSQYADMTALQNLPSEQVKVTAASSEDPADPSQDVTRLTITNSASNPSVAFFLRADIRRGNAAGQPASGDNEVLPVSYSDNDITLWPGQSETITASYAASGLEGATPVVSVYGWNVGTGTCGTTQSCSSAAIDTAASFSGYAVAAEAAAQNQHGVQALGLADGQVAPTEAVPGNGGGSLVTSAPATELSVSQTANSPTTTPATSFTQGDQNDTYAIVVKNVGKKPTDGTTPVTVSDTLAGDELGFVSMSGTGWTCDSSQEPLITCTETGGTAGGPAVLKSGQSYPPLTLTVSVGATAGYGDQGTYDGLHGTNAVTVSGGLATNPSYSTAAATPIVGRPDLTANVAQDGVFRQGDSADQYQVVVLNQGGGATSGSATDPIKAVFTAGAGTTITALYGSGWSCDLPTLTCTRTDALPGENGEEPPIIQQESVSQTATSETTTATEPSVTVSGGGDAVAASTVRTSTTIPAAATLAVSSSHSGSLAQGGTGLYTLSASTGAAPAGATQGQVVVTDTLPAGVTGTAMTGTGWTCPAALLAVAPTCFRSDATAAGSTYPPITVTVSVASNAPTGTVSNAVTASGGGAVATANGSDPTTITGSNATGSFPTPKAAALTVASSHQGTFSQGTSTGTYTLRVSNAANAGATRGVVTVTDTLPPNVTADELSGSGWTCSLDPVVLAPSPNTVWPELTCYRYDSLAAGASYPPITLTVSTANVAQASVTNAVSVSGGGSPSASTTDPTTVTQLPQLQVTAFTSVNGAIYAPFAQGDGPGVGDSYQILASNAGFAPTAGPVTVSVDLPSGLRASHWTAPAGWFCQVNSAVTCTTNQAIAAGATVPLTLGVTVTGNAPQWVQPIIQVSGGGEVPSAGLDLNDQYGSVTNGGVFAEQTYITPAG